MSTEREHLDEDLLYLIDYWYDEDMGFMEDDFLEAPT
jgi:hypothetical protein